MNSDKEEEERYVEHFKGVHNRPNSTREAVFSGDDRKMINIGTSSFTLSELKHAIMRMNREGVVLNSDKEQEERWVDHFKGVFNRPNPTSQAVFTGDDRKMLNIDTGSFTLSELSYPTKKLKRNKAGGEDEITSEMLQILTEDTKFALPDILNEILESEQVPEEWKHGLIIKLPKKGDLSDCNNWRVLP